MYFHVLIETEKNLEASSYRRLFELDEPELDVVKRDVISHSCVDNNSNSTGISCLLPRLSASS